MQKKSKISVILAILGLLLAACAGFAFGFDTGRITNDQDRIKKELSRISLSEPIEMREVARSKTGKLELQVLTDYLNEFQEYADRLKQCSERLDVLEVNAQDTMTIFEVVSVRQDNESSYLRLGQLMEKPEEYLLQRLEIYGLEYRAWVDDWSEALEVTECGDVWEDRLIELYENNKKRLENM